MGDKLHVTGDKMSVIDISDPVFAGKSAKIMARALVHKEYRGPADTIEATAYRLQSQYGVDADVILQGWNREPRGMLTHRWLPLFYTWMAAGLAKIDAKIDGAYDQERKRHDANSALVRLADLVAGKAVQPTQNQTGE